MESNANPIKTGSSVRYGIKTANDEMQKCGDSQIFSIFFKPFVGKHHSFQNLAFGIDFLILGVGKMKKFVVEHNFVQNDSKTKDILLLRKFEVALGAASAVLDENLRSHIGKGISWRVTYVLAQLL